ncbi:6-carboxy-5,6,7,8-tetrahydropterin synthase [Spirochaetia bacterium]|nr:6-carboxy-5,6,7,8-tetrahydropterin synthase [Spirochaetia bacterium]
MYSVRVEASFAAAHFLSHYRGKCENLHGHNYRVLLWAAGETLDSGGMLADFGLLKKSLKEVIACLDHRNLNDNPVFQNDPSAERIARYIYDALKIKLPENAVKASLLRAVEVFETPDSMARYEENQGD